MEEMMNNTTKSFDMKPPRPATLTLREDSHSISKPKPKIRIVHIFAPEIIKIDAANFRELVQRLTGKPAKRAAGCKKKVRHVVEEKKECGMWMEENSAAGGLLSGLGDVDGFLQGFCDFPMLPMSSSSNMDHMIGELSTS